MAPTRGFEPHQLVVGKYRLRKRLAAGGMGEVWVACNEATGAEVALKVVRRGASGNSADGELEERFRQEARLSAMLSHRSIVKVFDLLEEPDGTLVLVMELLQGETLHRYLDRLGPRSAVEAVAILTPVLGALAHAHDLGLVHRDVSPANIFLAVDPDGHVAPKLVDFGIAKRHGAASSVETAAHDVLGTPRYLAPERIRGVPDVDGRADVFSAGVVLYEAITGVSPFAAATSAASLAAVLERTIDPDARIDPRLWLEIRRAMAKQPYERHATARELATALRTALGVTDASLEACLRATKPIALRDVRGAGPDGQPAYTPGPTPSPPANQRIRTWLILGGALGALLAAGAMALIRTTRSEATSPPAAPTALASVPSAAVPPAPSAPTSPATVEPTRASPREAPAPRGHPGGRPRPVATTPGF